MGNNSYLISVKNSDNTLINWYLAKEEIDKINSSQSEYENWNYLYLDNIEESNVKSLQDFANFLNNKKLFGYLTNSYIKSLQKICLHTKFVGETKLKPKMFFEESGWKKIHFFEFNIGTEEITWGIYNFNFDIEKYEKEFCKEINIEWKRDADPVDDFVYENVLKKQDEYIYNLIYDKNTNWNIKILR